MSELQAWSSKSPYLIFHKESYSSTNPSLLPKVTSVSTINPSASLCSSQILRIREEYMLHLLDLHRQLHFCLDRAKPFRKSDQLFVAFSEFRKGKAVVKVTIDRWLQDCISYLFVERCSLPRQARAHSMKSIATSQALWSRVSLKDICVAASWASSRTFILHYKLNISRNRATFDSKVLRNSLPWGYPDPCSWGPCPTGLMDWTSLHQIQMECYD